MKTTLYLIILLIAFSACNISTPQTELADELIGTWKSVDTTALPNQPQTTTTRFTFNENGTGMYTEEFVVHNQPDSGKTAFTIIEIMFDWKLLHAKKNYVVIAYGEPKIIASKDEQLNSSMEDYKKAMSGVTDTTEFSILSYDTLQFTATDEQRVFIRER